MSSETRFQVRTHAEGPLLSRLVQGLMRLSEWGWTRQQRLAFIETLLDLGVTTFDHADIYGGYTCEGLFGEALALNPALRDRLQLVTKCGIQLVTPNRPDNRVKHYDTSGPHITASVDRSLRELRSDYIDLLLIHRPDPLMQADQTASALADLVRSGKVLHLGVSNFLPRQYDLLQSRLEVPLVTNQVEYSPLNMENQRNGILEHCQQHGIRPMIWSPFAGGRLFRGEDPAAQRVRSRMAEIGEQLGGAGIDQVALAWLLAHPAGLLPVLGSGEAGRVRRAAQALELRLDRQQWFSIWEAAAGEPVP